ncbi:MAG: DNA primase [Parcubacteria group bacterium]|nr:DNA primase [Parcubacteria group bacterium]
MAFNQLDEIKNKLDIVEVISQYVKLQKAGANYKALCPFHKEKTPSFIVSPTRQIFHCFGCGAGGDIFTFIMKIENLEFKDAVKLLADKAGVKLVYESPEINSQKQKLIEINQQAKEFFKQQLESNKEAKEYLQKRGLKKETIDEFELGFAPDDWRSLIRYLINNKFKPEEILQSGLAISKKEITDTNIKVQEADIYDRFRSRIMFPLQDLNNRTVGFTGRIFQGQNKLKTIKDIETVGKYVNSPQTLIYDKSKILYGLHKTKPYLHQQNSTLIVEGQMDFLMGWQSGLKNIVATSGTSLTAYQLTILKRYNNTLILGFDMDEAGEKAAERSIGLALGKELEVKVLQLSSGKDLADYLLENKEPSRIQQLIENALPIMEFYFSRAKTLGDINNLEGKKLIVSYFLPKVKKLSNALDRAFWLEKLSQYAKIDIQTLEDEIKRINAEPVTIIDENEAENKYSSSLVALEQNRYPLVAERIIAFLIKEPSFKLEVEKYYQYFPEEITGVLNLVLQAKTPEDLSVSNLKQIGLSEEIINKVNELALRADYELEILTEFNIDLQEEMTKQLKCLKQEAIKMKLKNLENDIKKEENNKTNSQHLKELLNQFNQLSKELLD